MSVHTGESLRILADGVIMGGENMPSFIEREAAIKELKAVYDPSIARFVRAKLALEAIPAADVRSVVRGHWVRKDSIAHGCVMRVCLCSACKRNALINEDGFWELSDFCPNCGADMREES